ncbi:hypothetical protein CEXT_340061 [Caerostris extrusa]|uniref:Uncharacterized protein n=1 Tax=Caerostris extrusa TaxID=172846 RepID=A0AAV4TJA4_CAEEX|nr:hypothetical protein CEXT_340061 [Caerostris extrusa]
MKLYIVPLTHETCQFSKQKLALSVVIQTNSELTSKYCTRARKGRIPNNEKGREKKSISEETDYYINILTSKKCVYCQSLQKRNKKIRSKGHFAVTKTADTLRRGF